jgi:hypothetical protein
MLSNTCARPTSDKSRCNGQMEFFGISHKAFRLPGWPKAVVVHFRWQQCQVCGQFREETFNGQVISTMAKLTDKQIETLFPTEERKHGFGKGRKVSKPKHGLQGGASA